jgi:metal-sulfur cluster biosynthetic enzyme
MVTKDKIWELLTQVFDPEVPVLNIIDLGIVRSVELNENNCKITITPTYSGCPAMKTIEEDIQNDFSKALHGIKHLPLKARFGVYVAFKYYYSLFKKIKKVQPQSILKTRIRIPDYGKLFILAKASIRSQLNLF